MTAFGQTDSEITSRDPRIRDRIIEQHALYKSDTTLPTWTDNVIRFMRDTEAIDLTGQHYEESLGLLADLLEYSYELHRLEGEPTRKIGFGIFAILDAFDTLPTIITRTRPDHLNKRSPSFIESVEATLRRYETMEQLPQVFGGLGDGIIVGGSMTYGPFYNVRKAMKGTDSSDIDTLVIFSEDKLEAVAQDGLPIHPAVSEEDTRQLNKRLGAFLKLNRDGIADVISQRFTIPGEDYNMSTHFFPSRTFEAMVGSQLEADLQNARVKDNVFEVKDFKPRRFEHPAANQRGFDGSQYAYPASEQPPFEGGVLATLPGYIIHEGKFYPGLYQNLVSPNFKVLFDSTGDTTIAVNGFRRIVSDYIRSERAKSNIADLSLSHTRSGIFAPNRYRDIPC